MEGPDHKASLSPSELMEMVSAIRRTEEFFHSLGIATRLSDYGVGQDTVDEIVRRFTERGAVWGERHDVTPDKVRKILEMAL